MPNSKRPRRDFVLLSSVVRERAAQVQADRPEKEPLAEVVATEKAEKEALAGAAATGMGPVAGRVVEAIAIAKINNYAT